jgi:hypothetical protein
MWHLLIPLFTGFLNRFRGGFLPTGSTQLARGIFSAGMSLVLLLMTGSWIAALAALPMWFVGLVIYGNGDWMGVVNTSQMWMGTLSGFINVMLIVVVLALGGFYGTAFTLLVAGLLKGPLYYVANRTPLQIPNLREGPEVGEALFGVALGFGLIGNLLLHCNVGHGWLY